MVDYSPEFNQVLELASQLSTQERLAIIDELTKTLQDDETDQDDSMTLEEIAELTRVEPLPPLQVAAEGLLGTWAHLGISDGAEWVNQQKRKRQARRKW